MNDKLIDEFVDVWGAMGSVWGINNSVARVHGLLIVSERSWCIDEMVERLHISKSNVSTSLKELRSWNVIRKVFKPGDRREFYVCEPNAWEMLFNILRERKRREFDPIHAGVADTYDKAKKNPSGIAIDRLEDMKKILDMFDKAANMALENEAQVRVMLRMFGGG
jgi:DNA-binding transcriptional regulator GbsR (MarR family)